MKRAFFSIAASCIVLAATSCGDAATEKVSHGTTNPEPTESQQTTNSSNTGMADTLSTNATLPGSAAPTGGSNE